MGVYSISSPLPCSDYFIPTPSTPWVVGGGGGGGGCQNETKYNFMCSLHFMLFTTFKNEWVGDGGIDKRTGVER